MSTAKRLYAFLSERLNAGERAVLVSVTDVTGASVRNPGAQMAVAADGAYVGSLSGGCIEQAVVGEALATLAAGAPRRLAYGAGSPIIDIRLPCGGRVDLLFTPLANPVLVNAVIAAQHDRRTIALVLRVGSGTPQPVAARTTGWTADGQAFAVCLVPPLRLCIAGHGATVEALVALAGAMDVDCEVLTPDEAIAARLARKAIAARLINSPRETSALTGDPWTAFVFLFHDHDWESTLIAAALAQPSLFVGAMGSKKTHAARIEALRTQGVTEGELTRIISPIGLIPSSRDPETLALSTLAQVVARYNAAKARAETNTDR